MRPRLIVIGPLPPPLHGVAISTSLVLASSFLQNSFDVEHVDTSDPRSREQIGRWDVGNVTGALSSLVVLWRRTRGRPGVVYLPLSQSAPGFLRDSLLIFLSRLRGWRVAAHLRGSELQRFHAGSNRIFRVWIRLALGRLSSLAVMGASIRESCAGLVDPDRIAVVPNGTPDPGQPPEDDDGSTVLFLSNLRRRKGVAEAIDAAQQVLGRHSSARFLFVGDWESAEVEREMRERAAGLDDRIRFLPPAHGDGKAALLRSASVFVFPPPEPEGHPRVVLEAMAAGLPIVTTDRGAIAETVIDGESGFVLDDPEPRQLASHVSRLLEDDVLRRRMGSAARRRFLAEYTVERADRRLTEWLKTTAPAPPEAR